MYSAAKVASMVYKWVADATNDKIMSLAWVAHMVTHAFFLGPSWSALLRFLRPRTDRGGELWFSSSDIVRKADVCGGMGVFRPGAWIRRMYFYSPF